MQVTVAKSAGFCFGVRRAVDMAQSLAREAEGDIYTLGPIIHNEEVVEELKQRGVLVLSSVQEAAVLTGGTAKVPGRGCHLPLCEKGSPHRGGEKRGGIPDLIDRGQGTSGGAGKYWVEQNAGHCYR